MLSVSKPENGSCSPGTARSKFVCACAAAGSRHLADCTGFNELLVRLLRGKSYKWLWQPGWDLHRLYQPRFKRKPAPWRARAPCMSQRLPAAAPVAATPIAAPAAVTPVAAPVSATPIATPVPPIGIIAPIVAPPAPPTAVATVAPPPVHLLDCCHSLGESRRRRQQTGSRGLGRSSCAERECPRNQDGERVQSLSHHVLLWFLGQYSSYFGVPFDTFVPERNINRCPGNVPLRHKSLDNLSKIDADRSGRKERSPLRLAVSWR